MSSSTKPTGRIMVVDDEPSNLKLVSKMLQSGGHEDIELIEDPRQVLGAYKAQRPDLILLDLNMPHFDGYQVMEQLRDLHDELLPPIVVLTAQNAREFMLKALEAGARDYLTKPFERDELMLRVRNGLSSQRKRLDLHQIQVDLREFSSKLEERVIRKTEELREANETIRTGTMNFVRSMVTLIDIRRGQAASINRGVAHTTRELARALKLPEIEAQRIAVAGLLHDMGLLALPDNLLNIAPLSFSERAHREYARHPDIGADLFAGLEELKAVAEAVRSHHEWFNGKGYPRGLKGTDIPLAGRIVAVAAAYHDPVAHELSTEPLQPSLVFKLISRAAESQFDPDVVQALHGLIASGNA